jgi:hypothetical protein
MIIRREALTAALAATTADDTRYFLHAMRLEPAAHRVTATNGHVLIVATDRAPLPDADFPIVPGAEFHADPDPVCLSADVAKSLIAAMPKKARFPILGCVQVSKNGSPNTYTVAATDLQAPRVATVDTTDAGQFPNTDRIWPAIDRPEVQVCFAVDVLETIIKAAKAVSGKKKALITFGVPTETPHVVQAVKLTIAGESIDVSGLAMPCKI